MSEEPQASKPPDDETLGVERRETGGSALALENARLRAELVRREQLGEVMASVGSAITSLRDQTEIMTEVVTLAGQAIGADASYIALPKERAWEPAYLWRCLPGTSTRVFLSNRLRSRSPCGRARRNDCRTMKGSILSCRDVGVRGDDGAVDGGAWRTSAVPSSTTTRGRTTSPRAR
jgi:hypothetical protein